MWYLILIITIASLSLKLAMMIYRRIGSRNESLKRIKSYNEKVYQTTDGNTFTSESEAVTHQSHLDKIVFYEVTLHNPKRLLDDYKYKKFSCENSVIQKNKIEDIYIGIKSNDKRNTSNSDLMIEELLFDILGSRVGFDGVNRYVRWEFNRVDFSTANKREKVRVFDDKAVEQERNISVMRKFNIDRTSISENKFDVFNVLSSQSMSLFTRQTVERLSPHSL